MKFAVTGILFTLFLMPLGASAQSDYTAKWMVSGLLIEKIVSIEYDLDFGSTHIAAHGSVTSQSGASLPSTGTCFETDGGATCNMSFGSRTIILDIAANLSGTIKVFSPDGSLQESGSLTP